MNPYPRQWPMLLAGQAITQPIVQVIVWLTDWPPLVKLAAMLVTALVVAKGVVWTRWWFWDRANPPERRVCEWHESQVRAAPWN